MKNSIVITIKEESSLQKIIHISLKRFLQQNSCIEEELSLQSRRNQAKNVQEGTATKEWCCQGG